jgi:hypothetical protein
MILKVQLPLSTNDEPKALLYNKARNVELLHGITDHIREQMRGRPKALLRRRPVAERADFTGGGPGSGMVTITLEEEDRQLTLLALACSSLLHPGFDYALGEIAENLHGRPMFEELKRLNADRIKPL